MDARKNKSNGDNTLARYKQLKKDYLNAERISLNEKNTLVRIINTYGPIIATHGDFSLEVKAIKDIVNSNKALPLDKIEEKITRFKEKVYAEEQKTDVTGTKAVDKAKPLEGMQDACNVIRQIQMALTDNFYPINSELKQKAEVLKDCCRSGMSGNDLTRATDIFLSFINGLKLNISNDIRYINQTFMTLSSHVREVEKSLMSEFSGDVRIKEIEQFESKINDEVGSIVNSFNLHETIDQIKANVIDKLSTIKKIVSLQKKEELVKSQRAEENINKLKKRIEKAEKDAHQLSKKAQYLRIAATKDKLTGLNNRDALDGKLRAVLHAFESEGKPVCLALFDIDNFKWINDTFGHVSGDKVLKRVAECLSESFRKHDFIARYGGDEFAVVIDEMNEDSARNRIDTFNRNFRKKRFRSHDTQNVNVTVSAGITSAQNGETPNDLIHRADMDMYESKKLKPKIS